MSEVHETHALVHARNQYQYPPPIPPEGICVHMQEKVTSPIQPHAEGMAREMMSIAQQMQAQFGNDIQEKILSDSVVVLSHEDYNRVGRLAPGDKLKLILEVNESE